MKTNLKFMLVALLAVFGFSKASAQFTVGGKINVGYYQYKVTEKLTAKKTAKVTLLGWTTNPKQADGSIALPGSFDYADGMNTYKVTVTAIAQRNNADFDLGPASQSAVTNVSEATKVVIPKDIVTIGEGAFWGCSSMTSIAFEEGSKVQTIGRNCFATTQISDFDFSPCTELQALETEVFVQPGLPNTYITKVTLPTGPLFKHIGKAFQNLKNLAQIVNLDKSYIQEVVAEAFKNCDKLTTLSLPGNNLQYIDKQALAGSSIETLSINVSKLKNLSGGTVDPTTFAWSSGGSTANIYNQGVIKKTPLKKLTLTGTLTGIIDQYAFAYCDKLNGILDLTGMTFGSTGQIASYAFRHCYNSDALTGITGVKIADITDNRSGDPAVAALAFDGCTLLATVVIGDITTANAIGNKAFGENLKDVTIGTIKADGAVFQAGAFSWKKVSGATLSLAQGEGDYLNANTVSTPIIPADVFNMSSITGLGDEDVYPVIKIGEIRSLGGVFAAGALMAPTKIKELTFTGSIAANGLDQAIINTAGYEGLTAITFKGAIGTAGIATGAFATCTKITTLTFEGLLAENAVAAGAFAITDDGSSTYTLNYDCAEVPDYTVNPFAKGALNGTADAATTRFVVMKVKNSNLAAYFGDEVIGLTTDKKFDVYLVKAMADAASTGFIVYQDGTSKLAWGRYDLGSFTVEKKDKLDNEYTATDMSIPRFQEVQDGAATVKVTIYGVYTDCNPKGGSDFKGETSVYMVPLQVVDGNYQIPSTNTKPLIIRAEAISGAFTDQNVKIGYDVPASITNNSVWTELPDFGAARGFNKNQTGNTVTTQILWDRTQPANYDVWGSDAEFAKRGVEYTDYAPKAIYCLANPSNYQGFDIVKVLVSETSGRIGVNWYYSILPHYGKTESAARIVWMNDEEATAIFGVKGVKSASSDNGATYNLAGMKVDASYKGIVIKNGKKYIQK